MSVIIRLQNLPWSANALDIRNFFRGLSIPEGGVHIVGGELGDAFIAFSTDEDARQGMMLDGGKIKEIQVKLLLSSRSEMHKVIEAARQSVPLLSLAPVTTAPAPVPTPMIPTTQPAMQMLTPFATALGNHTLASFGIPGLGNPLEIPQPAVIEPPAPLISPSDNPLTIEEDNDDRDKEKDKRKDRRRSRSRSREKKDRKRDRRDRSRSRERRRRDRSRSRERRDRKRDRKDRSRSRDRSPSRRSRDKRDRKSPANSQEKDSPIRENSVLLPFNNPMGMPMMGNGPNGPVDQINRFQDPSMMETLNKMQELAKKRNPNAFQGEQNGGKPQGNNRGEARPARGGAAFRGARTGRFEDQQRDCCVAIRNAPNHTSYGDVRRFFPFMIDKHGIKMINDNTGRRTGNIFVRFCETRSKQIALQRKNNELKGAIVDVEDLDDDTYDAAVDSFLPYRQDNDTEEPGPIIPEAPPKEHAPSFAVIKLSDLPNFVKEHDIIKAFSEFSLMAIMIKDCRMTRSKIAHVQFAKREDAKEAFDRRERYMFGRRQPTITAVSDEEFEKEKMLQTQPERVERVERVVEREDPVPEPAAPRDPRQRRQFEAAHQAPLLQAPTQQQQQQQQFFVPQFPQQQGFPGGFPGQFPSGYPPGPGPLDPRAAATNWAARPQFHNQMGASPGPQGPAPVQRANIEDAPLDCVLMKGLPRDATDRTIVNFLSDTGAVPARIHLMLDAGGLPSGDCFCEFRSPQEARMAAARHGAHLEGCRVSVDLVPRALVEDALDGPKPIEPEHNQQFYDPNMRGAFNGRGGFRGRGNFDQGRGFGRGGFEQRGGYDAGRGGYRGRGFERGRGEGRGRGRGRGGGGPPNRFNGGDEPDPALEDFGAPGCVVSMENVPFRASIDEILQFFSEFELTQDDIIRRYNERGQPTGDARVAFRAPFDAQRAVKTRHMDTIHDRRITLSLL